MAAKAATLEAVSGIPVEVAGQTVHIARLTLEQWCDLAKVVASRAVKLDKKEAEKASAAAKDGDVKASIGFLFELLDPDGIAGLYSVLTGIPAKKLRDNFNMAEFISVVGAMKETGELPEVFSAFTKVVEGW